MTGMPATDIAVEYARSHPAFSFGLHLTVVGDGVERPISAPEDVPALVNARGFLRGTNEVRVRALLGRLPRRSARAGDRGSAR